MKENSKYWKPEFKNWKNVETKAYEFIYEEALKMATHELDVSKRITERAFSLILFIFPMMTLICGLLIFPEVGPKMSIHLKILGVIICLIFAGSLFILIDVIFPRQSKGLGRLPQQLSTSTHLEHKGWNSEETYKFLLRTQLIAYNDNILFNLKQNNERAKKIKHCLIALEFLLGFITLLVTFSLINYNLLDFQ